LGSETPLIFTSQYLEERGGRGHGSSAVVFRRTPRSRGYTQDAACGLKEKRGQFGKFNLARRRAAGGRIRGGTHSLVKSAPATSLTLTSAMVYDLAWEACRGNTAGRVSHLTRTQQRVNQRQSLRFLCRNSSYNRQKGSPRIARSAPTPLTRRRYPHTTEYPGDTKAASCTARYPLTERAYAQPPESERTKHIHAENTPEK